MLFSVEQAFVVRDERRAPVKTPAWEARSTRVLSKIEPSAFITKLLARRKVSKKLI